MRNMDENYIELVRESLGFKNQKKPEDNLKSSKVFRKLSKPKLSKDKPSDKATDKVRILSEYSSDKKGKKSQLNLRKSRVSSESNIEENNTKSCKDTYAKQEITSKKASDTVPKQQLIAKKKKLKKPTAHRDSDISVELGVRLKPKNHCKSKNFKSEIDTVSPAVNSLDSDCNFSVGLKPKKCFKSKSFKSSFETDTVSSSDSDEVIFQVVAPSKSNELVTEAPQNVGLPKKKKTRVKKHVFEISETPPLDSVESSNLVEPFIDSSETNLFNVYSNALSSTDSEKNVKVKKVKQKKVVKKSNKTVSFEDFSSKYELIANQGSRLAEEYTSVQNLFNCPSSNENSVSEKVEKKKEKRSKKSLKKSLKTVAKDNAGFEESFEINDRNMNESTDNNNDWKTDNFDFYETNNEVVIDTVAELKRNKPVDVPKIQKPFKLLKSTINDDQYIVLQPNSSLYFYGLISVEVISGELEVLGSVGTKLTGEQQLYSPRGTALLYLRNYKNDLSENELSLNELGIVANDKSLVNENCVVFKYLCFKEPVMNFVVKHTSQQILPENDKPIFDPDGNFAKLKTDEQTWDPAIELLDSNDKKLMIIGGKSVGKSTFLRYAINKLLARYPRVRLVDLDPGQAEFTVPGCISIITVEKPVFGPNYTHLKNPDISVLSNINVASDIKKYITSVTQLKNELDQMEAIPTLINFMGFTQHIGYDILSACIAIYQPEYVLNILSKSANKNYQFPVNVKNVKEHCTTFCNIEFEGIKNFETIEIKSLAESNEAWSLEPRQAREMCVVAYFGQMMSENVKSLTSSDLKMFCVELSSIKITDFDNHDISPLAANANLVALCSLPHENMDIFQCHGHGVVRGVDLTSGILVLLTPLDGAALEKVSHLVVASVALPPSLLMTADDVIGHVPYVSRGEVVGLGQFTKRSYLPKK